MLNILKNSFLIFIFCMYSEALIDIKQASCFIAEMVNLLASRLPRNLMLLLAARFFRQLTSHKPTLLLAAKLLHQMAWFLLAVNLKSQMRVSYTKLNNLSSKVKAGLF